MAGEKGANVPPLFGHHRPRASERLRFCSSIARRMASSRTWRCLACASLSASASKGWRNATLCSASRSPRLKRPATPGLAEVGQRLPLHGPFEGCFNPLPLLCPLAMLHIVICRRARH